MKGAKDRRVRTSSSSFDNLSDSVLKGGKQSGEVGTRLSPVSSDSSDLVLRNVDVACQTEMPDLGAVAATDTVVNTGTVPRVVVSDEGEVGGAGVEPPGNVSCSPVPSPVSSINSTRSLVGFFEHLLICLLYTSDAADE